MNTILDNNLFLLTLVGAVFFITGLIMYFFPPKKINGLYGYRTASSVKSQERWDFSQKYAAQTLIITSLFLIAISILGSFLKLSATSNLILGIAFLVISLFVIINRVEKAIKRKFPQ